MPIYEGGGAIVADPEWGARNPAPSQQKWTLAAIDTASSFELVVNPTSGGTPNLRKRIDYAVKAGENGKALIYDRGDEAQNTQVSGVILEEAQLTMFLTLIDEDSRFTLTDHLNRSYTIYATSLQLTRSARASHQWFQEYKLDYIILAGVI